MKLKSRLATRKDMKTISELMALSMEKLLKDVLTPAQVAKSHASMGLDTQLLDDRTYFIISDKDVVVGCGGWSRRRTLFGGNHSAGRDNALANPKTEPAKIRAMYTHPGHVRRVLAVCFSNLGKMPQKPKALKR